MKKHLLLSLFKVLLKILAALCAFAGIWDAVDLARLTPVRIFTAEPKGFFVFCFKLI